MKSIGFAGALAFLAVIPRQDVPAVVWRTDFEAARREAEAAKKPLFILFQCERRIARKTDVPLLNPQDRKLASLLSEKFVPVRLVSLKGVDLSRFRFDYDQTFMALGQTPEGKTLFRWSSRSDDPKAIAEVVPLLERPWPASESPAPALAAPRTLLNDAPFAQTKRAGEPCYHCHYAHDAELVALRKAGTFQKSMLFRYPPPESIGVTLESAASSKVKAITPGSAADKAGIKAGDVLVTVNEQPISTAEDLRYALDSTKDSVLVTLERAGARQARVFSLKPGWRVYDISDRPSQGAIPPVVGIWEEPLDATQKKALGISENRIGLKVSFLFPGEKWKPSQGELRIDDVIIQADGKLLPSMTPRQFHAWIRLNKEVGQTLSLTVLRDNERKIISVRCIDVGGL